MKPQRATTIFSATIPYGAVCLCFGVILLPAPAAADLSSDLLKAVQQGNIPTVRRLVEAGADVNTTLAQNGGPKTTALYWAAGAGNAKLCDFLLAAGARVNGGSGVTEVAGGVPPDLKEIVEMLLDHGADPNTRTKRGSDRFEIYADSKGMRVNVGIDAPQSPLAIACLRGYADVVKLLLKANADVNSAGGSGHTPLLLALGRGQPVVSDLPVSPPKRGFVLIPEELMKEGSTPLMMAARLNSSGIVRLLLARGADPGLKNGLGETAMTIARRHRFGEVAAALAGETLDTSMDVSGTTAGRVGPQNESAESSSSVPQLIDTYCANPRAPGALANLERAASRSGRRMNRPPVVFRAQLRADERKYKIIIDPRLRNQPDVIAAWMVYGGAAMKWRNELKTTTNSPETIGEVISGLQAMAEFWEQTIAKNPQAQDQELALIRELHKRSFLPAFAYFERFSSSTEAGFRPWGSEHKDILVKYVNEVLLTKE